jgi:hypothetical protein
MKYRKSPANRRRRMTEPNKRRESQADALRRIGSRMANLCHNLSQRAGKEPVSERYAEMMKEVQVEWDKLLRSIRKGTHA